MASWHPNPQSLAQLYQLIVDSKSIDADTRNLAAQHLEQARNLPDYTNYLVFIFAYAADQGADVRSTAGLVLKNNLRRDFQDLTASTLSYIKAGTEKALTDRHDLIRSVAGTIITTIVTRGGIVHWPEILQRYMEMAENSDPILQESALSGLAKICEDSNKMLDQTEFHGQRPLDFMIPKFIQYSESPNPKIRSTSLFCLNQFTFIKSQSLYANLDSFIQVLFRLATDPNSEVRKNVCQALVQLVDVRPDKIAPSIKDVVRYMLISTEDEDEMVALEACEFWLAVAEQPSMRADVEPFLPDIVPRLLKSMVYTDDDVAILGGDEEDYHVADSASDINPQLEHSQSKSHKVNGMATERPPTPRHVDGAEGTEDEDAESYDGYSEDEDEDEGYSDWNLRKCSAAALDVLSNVYNAHLFEVIKPFLVQNIRSEDWKIREASVLALGAIAEGCMDGVVPHLPELYPYLLSLLRDPKFLVRQISCWTLGRYGRWAAFLPTEEEKVEFFHPLMEGLLRTVYDNNKKVQEAGCSAFATLEEQAGPLLIPYLKPILQHLRVGFDRFQHKNLLILYDAILTLADSVGQALNEPEYINLLVPPLLSKWQQIGDEDRGLVSLLECLSSVAVALGPGFQRFTVPVFKQAHNLIHQTLIQDQQYQQGAINDPPDKEFLVAALDLMSGLVQSMGEDLNVLIQNSEPKLVEMLTHCLIDEIDDVRQSGFALLGDLAISCFPFLRPFMQEIMQALVPQIQPDGQAPSVCNNAAWAAGEIAIQLGPQIQPFVIPLLQALIQTLNRENTPGPVVENSAIAIGRLGLVCPDEVAPNLPVFASSFIRALKDLRDNDEKDSAFRGFCTLIGKNPSGLSSDLTNFVIAVAKYTEPSQELAEMFHTILHGYKSVISNWQEFQSTLPPPLPQKLSERYGV